MYPARPLDSERALGVTDASQEAKGPDAEGPDAEEPDAWNPSGLSPPVRRPGACRASLSSIVPAHRAGSTPSEGPGASRWRTCGSQPRCKSGSSSDILRASVSVMKEQRTLAFLFAGVAGAIALLSTSARLFSDTPAPAAAEATPPSANAAPLPRKLEFDPERGRALHRALQQRKLGTLQPPQMAAEGAARAAPLPDVRARYDAFLLQVLGMPVLASVSPVDALGPEGPKVALDVVEGKCRGAQVDLDRDGQWDERWEYIAGQAHRHLSPSDDGRFERHLIFTGGVWTLPPGSAAGFPPPAE